MATISAYTSSSISTLFSGLNSSSSNNSFGIGSLDLSTYNSIKTGAYKQLLKSGINNPPKMYRFICFIATPYTYNTPVAFGYIINKAL